MIRINPRDAFFSLPERRKEIRCRLAGDSVLPVFFYSLYPNWGDHVGPFILEAFCGRPVVKSYFGLRKHLLSIGSILEQANSKSVVWGSGLKEATDSPISQPHMIASVRGPLTRSRLKYLGLDCPERYGDPALLLPSLYPKKKCEGPNKIGVVLHKSHKKYEQSFQAEVFQIIDLATSDVRGFVDALCSCEMVVSSSLHGLIAADAYGIPNVWVDFEGMELSSFKFLDYYGSLGQSNPRPLVLSVDSAGAAELFARAKINEISNEILESIRCSYETAISQF